MCTSITQHAGDDASAQGGGSTRGDASAQGGRHVGGDASVQDGRLTKRAAESRTETTHLLRHEDINGAGRLFGGRLMEWIDDAAGIAALRHCGGRVTTACVDTLQFRRPAFLGDVVVIVARVTYVGTSSLEVRVDSFVEDVHTGERALCNSAFITEVHVDEAGRAQPVPYGLELADDDERAEWEHALFRREMRAARADSGV